MTHFFKFTFLTLFLLFLNHLNAQNLAVNCPDHLEITPDDVCGLFQFSVAPISDTIPEVVWSFGDSTSDQSGTVTAHYFNYAGYYPVIVTISGGNCGNSLVLDTLLYVAPCGCNDLTFYASSSNAVGAVANAAISFYNEIGVFLASDSLFFDSGPVQSVQFCIPDGCFNYIIEINGNDGATNGFYFHLSNNGDIISDTSSTQLVNHTYVGNVGINSSCNLNCNASFNPTPIFGPGTWQFVNTSVYSGLASWSWAFPDGNTSSEESPTFYFSTPGVYDVCLNMVTADNCSSSHCETITVTGILEFCLGSYMSVGFNVQGMGYTPEVALELYNADNILIGTDSMTWGDFFYDTLSFCLDPGCYSYRIHGHGFDPSMPFDQVWLKTFQSVSQVTNLLYFNVSNGDFTLEGQFAIDDANCTVGVNESQANTSVLFPVPCGMFLNISPKNNAFHKVMIFSSDGRIVASTSGYGTIQCDTSSLANGLYLLKILDAKGDVVEIHNVVVAKD